MNNAMCQKSPPPRAASTVYFTLDDDGDVLVARPTPLVEVWPQPRVLRHTAAHIVDIVPFVQILTCLYRSWGTGWWTSCGRSTRRRLSSRLSSCPRSLWTGSRSAPCVVVHGELNSWWKCLLSCPILLYGRGLPSRSPTFQFLMVVAIEAAGEVFKGFAQDRIQQRLAEQCPLAFQFLIVVVGSVRQAFKGQQRLGEQISLTFGFLVVEVFLDQLLLPHPRTRAVDGAFAWVFWRFSHWKKVRGWVRTRVGTGCRWCSRTTSLSRRRRRRRRRTQRLALQRLRWRRVLKLGFGLCGSACGSWSSTWVGPYGGVPMAIGAPFAHSWAVLHPEATAHEHELASYVPE